jgi:hypothetical protein
MMLYFEIIEAKIEYVYFYYRRMGHVNLNRLKIFEANN